MRLLLISLLGMLMAGCTSAIILRHPQTGQTTKCGPYLTFGIHSYTVPERERACVHDFQRQGYERVP